MCYKTGDNFLYSTNLNIDSTTTTLYNRIIGLQYYVSLKNKISNIELSNTLAANTLAKLSIFCDYLNINRPTGIYTNISGSGNIK